MPNFVLTEQEVALAASLGILFKQTPAGNGQMRLETVNEIKFIYKANEIQIEEYWPDGHKEIHIISIA